MEGGAPATPKEWRKLPACELKICASVSTCATISTSNRAVLFSIFSQWSGPFTIHQSLLTSYCSALFVLCALALCPLLPAPRSLLALCSLPFALCSLLPAPRSLLPARPLLFALCFAPWPAPFILRRSRSCVSGRRKVEGQKERARSAAVNL
jgi:hypothetical protein